MDQLIPVINELQAIFRSVSLEEIKLPEVVVVGSQSSGKSSVLESLVGKSFLPRGIGIVTRCPIILQLTQLPENKEDKNNNDIWTFSFDNDPKEYTDEEEVRQIIVDRTNELTGHKDKGITKEPIFVRVASTKIIPLTVVDLPGIVKVKIGEQPEDIEDLVRELITEKIRNPNAIILAVSPANADIATSDSIKFAKAVDPKQERTLSVVTKLDIMDKGTNAKKLLNGEIIKMNKGIIGVVCRSQQDIEDNVSIQESLENEKIFLKKNYPTFKTRIGSEFLAKKINEILKQHIKDSLPNLKKTLDDLAEKQEKILDDLGPTVIDSDKKVEMEEIINKFCNFFEKVYLKGRIAIDISNANDQNSRAIRNRVIDVKNLDVKIKKALICSGTVEGFISIEDALKLAAQENIKELTKQCIFGAKSMHTNLLRVVDKALKKVGKKWPNLNVKISYAAKKLLKDNLTTTIKSIKKHVEIQACAYFTLDPSVTKIEKKVDVYSNRDMEVETNEEHLFQDEPEMIQNNKQANNQTKDGRGQACEAIIRNWVTAYCKIVQKQLADYLPKHNSMHLFHESLKLMKKVLRKEVEGLQNELISESLDNQELRKEAEEVLKGLTDARAVIDKHYFALSTQ